jgi:hypothetical protein
MRMLVVALILTLSAPTQAQGISTVRDASGNLVERGAQTRSYPTTPMANSSVIQRTPQGYVAIIRRGAVAIRARR